MTAVGAARRRAVFEGAGLGALLAGLALLLSSRMVAWAPMPGFGVLAAVLAVTAAAVLVRPVSKHPLGGLVLGLLVVAANSYDGVFLLSVLGLA